MNRPNVEEIKARADAATPGPWVFSEARRPCQYVAVVPITPGSSQYVVAAKEGGRNPWHDAAFIAAVRTDIPALIARVRELEAQIAAVVAIHRVDTVYDECEHDHAEEDAANGVVYAGEAGLTCAKVHDVCRNCCVNALGGQSDICSDEHQHGPNEPPCRTIAALRALGWKEQEK